MSNLVKIEFELIEAMPEIRLIQLLMEASMQFDEELSLEEKNRAIKYFNDWNSQKAS